VQMTLGATSFTMRWRSTQQRPCWILRLRSDSLHRAVHVHGGLWGVLVTTCFSLR